MVRLYAGRWGKLTKGKSAGACITLSLAWSSGLLRAGTKAIQSNPGLTVEVVSRWFRQQWADEFAKIGERARCYSSLHLSFTYVGVRGHGHSAKAEVHNVLKPAPQFVPASFSINFTRFNVFLATIFTQISKVSPKLISFKWITFEINTISIFSLSISPLVSVIFRFLKRMQNKIPKRSQYSILRGGGSLSDVTDLVKIVVRSS